ncbi:MAG: cytosine permease [Planctomycetota bacterium]|jgi:cytosine permease
MSNGMLPSYLSMAKPNPTENRAPWYKGTAPVYAGIFLWVAFYMEIANGTLSQAGLGLCLLGLVIAALICHYLFYLVPGLFGMKTGYPLYVVGSSTYGTLGGFLLPGLLMGLLQFGWLAVNTALATDFILQATGRESAVSMVDGALVFNGSAAFTVIAIIWAAVAVFMAIKGIQYIGKVSTFLPIVPLVMILIVFFSNVGTAGKFTRAEDGEPLIGFLTIIAIVVGFFATAGAAGVDFGMGNRNAKDVQLGGLVGIALAILVAGGLPLIAIAGAHGAETKPDSYLFSAVIETHFLSKIMFVLFAVASFPAACFCSFIAGNSIGTLFPKTNKTVMVAIGAVVSIILAATGWALNLAGVFGIIGASFGPICGSMAADYLLSGRRWAGPRKGINLAGYIAWLVGFVVAILPMVVKGEDGQPGPFDFIRPAPVIAFVIGFVLYAVLAKVGLQPEVVEMTAAPAEAPSEEAPSKEAPSEEAPSTEEGAES